MKRWKGGDLFRVFGSDESTSLHRLSWLRFGGDVIACLLQGFLQKFCIGREMSYSSTGLQRTKTTGGTLQLGFRIDGSHELFGVLSS